MKDISLLVLAAGLGSRYNGQKQIDPISDSKETLMEFALYDAVNVGIRKFVFIVNDKFPDDYKEHLRVILAQKDSTVHFIEQTPDKYIPEEFVPQVLDRPKPLGTGHAVYCAKDVINEPFITTNADDFYGFETIKTAYDWVQKDVISPEKFGMLAFKLKNTLSKNGTVSRGVCQVENGYLKHVGEFKKIADSEDGLQGNNEEGQIKSLNEDDLVSMNFWMLHPSFFDMAKRDLETFLKHTDDIAKDEFYLPSVVDNGLKENKIKVDVLSTSEKWFGLTYHNDKKEALTAISDRKAEGAYPEKLWG